MKIINLDNLSNIINNLSILNEKIDFQVGATFTKYNFKLKKAYTESQLNTFLQKLKRVVGKKCFIAPIEKPMTLSIYIENETRQYPKYLHNCNELKNHSSGSMLFGIDLDGNKVIYNIQKTKSILVAGSTGGGKSVCMNNLIMSLAQYSSDDVEINLIDLKQVEFSIYAYMKCVKYLAIDFTNAIYILKDVCKEIDKRYKKMRELGIRQATTKEFKINITFIDEYAQLTAQNQSKVDELVSKIASVGRACNCYLVIATQHPTNKTISNIIRSNIPSRIGLRCTNTAQSVNVLGSRECTELLGYGDAYLSIDGVKDLKRVQVCNITEDDITSKFIKV